MTKIEAAVRNAHRAADHLDAAMASWKASSDALAAQTLRLQASAEATAAQAATVRDTIAELRQALGSLTTTPRRITESLALAA